ncbi:hypothetical protein [Nocardia brasiliensis]|uniref:hypothetical protein n=1 Tax=Nocardia brasiliensis TaxID=37326 RepID=UPI00245478D9|nr:hypothetical protein [Nocardia brasiliensis]
MNMRTFAQVLADGIAANTTGYTDATRGPDLYVGGPIDISGLARYVRDAYTLTTAQHFEAAPVYAVAVDSDWDRDVIAKDEQGWFTVAFEEGKEQRFTETGRALLMPWKWAGEDQQLRAVDVPTPVENQS